MKKILLIISLFFIGLIAFPQQYFSKGFISNGDGNFLTGTKIQLSGYYIRHSADSVWLEKPLGIWVASISEIPTIAILDSTKLVTKADLYEGNLNTNVQINSPDGSNYIYMDDEDVSIISNKGGVKYAIQARSGDDEGYVELQATHAAHGVGQYLYLDTLGAFYQTHRVVDSSLWIPDKEYVDDAIGGVSITETDPIFAADSNTLVRWTDTVATGKIATKADLVETVETASRTIYVSTTGDDVTGTGLVGAPFATPLRAFQDIKDIVGENVTITINFSSGSYTWSYVLINEETRKTHLMKGSKIVINGTTITDVSGLTITTAGGETPYIYNVAGATFTTNQYQDYFMSNGSVYYPIVKNGTNTINSCLSASGYNRITHNGVTFNIVGSGFGMDFSIDGNRVCDINNVNIVSSSSDIAIKWRGVMNLYYCKINANSLSLDNISTNRVNFRGCISVLTTDGFYSYTTSQIRHSSFRKSGTLGGSGIIINIMVNKVPLLSAYGVYLYNWQFGIESTGAVYDGNQTNGSLIIDGCTTAFGFSNGTWLHFSTAESKVYITGVTNLIAKRASNGTMLGNYGLTIEDLHGTPTNWGTAEIKANGYNNPGKNIAINVEGLYGEFATPATYTLADNSSGSTIVGDITQNESVKIEYKINRGTSEEVGTIVMTKKADTNLSDISYFDDCGVSFTKSLVGNAITLNWATTSTGEAATIKYSITRIML